MKYLNVKFVQLDRYTQVESISDRNTYIDATALQNGKSINKEIAASKK